MNPAQTPTFTPSPALAGQLIAQFSDPTLSLADLAARHDTTLESLALWIARSETSDRLDHLHSIAITHTRYLSSLLVSKSIAALARVLDAAQADLDSDKLFSSCIPPVSSPGTQSPSPTPPPSSTPNPPSSVSPTARSPELRQRTLETLRRTATRILQLSTYNPPRLFAPPQLPRAMQHPRGHAPAMQYPRGHAGANDAARPPAAQAPLPSARPMPAAQSPRGHAGLDRATRPQPSLPPTSISTPILPVPDLTTLLRSPPRSPAALLQTAGAATPSFSSRSNEHWP